MSSEMDVTLDPSPIDSSATPQPNQITSVTTNNDNNNVTQSTAVSTAATTTPTAISTSTHHPATNIGSTSTTACGTRATLEPLQLVWAKCRGYPWYPALIIDPAIPRGFIYNGVPLPAPPADVLALRKEAPAYNDATSFLVLFFDAKRTWQWLPPNKLELLGLDKHVDQSKLVESRKPADRKAVKKAYQDALHYQSQVSDLDGQGPGAIM